jgi:hypothetical protein
MCALKGLWNNSMWSYIAIMHNNVMLVVQTHFLQGFYGLSSNNIEIVVNYWVLWKKIWMDCLGVLFLKFMDQDGVFKKIGGLLSEMFEQFVDC